MAVVCFAGLVVLVFQSAEEKSRQVITLTRLKVVGREIHRYSQENTGNLPSLQNIDSLRQDIGSHEVSEAGIESAGWHLPFATNSMYSQASLKEIADASEVALVFEAKAIWNGGKYRGVLFADGHAKSVDSNHWQEIRKISNLSEFNEPVVAPWWEFGNQGPRRPIPKGTLVDGFGVFALFLTMVAAILRSRQATNPVVEFFVVWLFYSVVCLGIAFVGIALVMVPQIGRG